MSISKEQEFWAWFQENEEMLFNFERHQEWIFGELGAALNKISTNLTFEFGPIKNSARDFVIGASGIKSAFPEVESLAAAAPVLPRWNLIKFRPRRAPRTLSYGGKTVSPENVEFCLLTDGSKLGIYLFFNNCSEVEDPIWGQIGYLLLDGALGEYDVETKVGMIGVFPFSANLDAARYPLPELPPIFDAQFAALELETLMQARQGVLAERG